MSPGGFVYGVSAGELLSAPPTPQNTCLADALKRSGYSERTGRGIDMIFAGCARYGRPLPDYLDMAVRQGSVSTADVRRLFGGVSYQKAYRLVASMVDKGLLAPNDKATKGRCCMPL